MLVSVIVLNWNGSSLIDDCLTSVFDQSYINKEIIVVDNGSTDDSLEKIDSYDVKLIENNENLGFAKGINTGIKAAMGVYILPLNNDVVLDKEFIQELVNAVLKDKKTGSVCGKLLRAEDKKLIDSTGHSIHKNRLPKNIGKGEQDGEMFSKREEVFGVCGAAPMYKKEMLDDIKIDDEYYDESFFSFLEDVDLDWRARLRGWKAYYEPKAVGFHYRGGTAVRRSPIVEVHNYKNRYLMIIKNDYLISFFKNIHQIIFTDIIKNAALLFRCPKALTGIFQVIRLLPKTIKKRRNIRKRRKVSRKEIEKWFLPFNYKEWFHTHMKTDVYDLRTQIKEKS